MSKEIIEEQNEKETIPQLFGKNVKKFRKMRKLTQEQLAEKLCISQKHLSIIETGTQFASATLIGKISEELNVLPGDLFGGTSNEFSKELSTTRTTIISAIKALINSNLIVMDKVDLIKKILEEKNPQEKNPFALY